MTEPQVGLLYTVLSLNYWKFWFLMIT